MKKRRTLFPAISILLVLLVVGVIQIFRPNLYYGKTINGWIASLCSAPEYGESSNARDRLVEIGEPAVKRLIAALNEEEPFYMPTYRKLWTSLPSGPRNVLPSPHFDEFRNKRDIFEVLASIDIPSREVLSAFRRGATNTQNGIQFSAVNDIRYFSVTNAILFTPILTNALHTAPDNVRGAAAAVFGTWESDAAFVLPELLNRLSSPRDPAFQNSPADSRIHVANSLVSIGVASPEVLDVLSEAMKDPNPRLRLFSARALYRLTGEVEPSLSVVEEILKSSDDEIRSIALSVASAFGTNAARLMPIIETFNPLIEVPLQIDVANFVWKVFGNSDSTMQILTEAMMSGERQYQLRAVRVIADMGSKAVDTIPSLIHVLSTDQDWLVQDLTVGALQAMGTNAVPALPALTNLLDHRVLRVQRSAASAIEGISANNPNSEL